MNIKWTDKYQPNSINDICGYDNEIKVIKLFIKFSVWNDWQLDLPSIQV